MCECVCVCVHTHRSNTHSTIHTTYMRSIVMHLDSPTDEHAHSIHIHAYITSGIMATYTYTCAHTHTHIHVHIHLHILTYIGRNLTDADTVRGAYLSASQTGLPRRLVNCVTNLICYEQKRFHYWSAASITYLIAYMPTYLHHRLGFP